jgi:hypothetical protein
MHVRWHDAGSLQAPTYSFDDEHKHEWHLTQWKNQDVNITWYMCDECGALKPVKKIQNESVVE